MEIAKKFPNRIHTIYIRSVADRVKARRTADLIDATTHVEVKLIQNTAEAHEHALSKGYYQEL